MIRTKRCVFFGWIDRFTLCSIVTHSCQNGMYVFESAECRLIKSHSYTNVSSWPVSSQRPESEIRKILNDRSSGYLTIMDSQDTDEWLSSVIKFVGDRSNEHEQECEEHEDTEMSTIARHSSIEDIEIRFAHVCGRKSDISETIYWPNRQVSRKQHIQSHAPTKIDRWTHWSSSKQGKARAIHLRRHGQRWPSTRSTRPFLWVRTFTNKRDAVPHTFIILHVPSKSRQRRSFQIWTQNLFWK